MMSVQSIPEQTLTRRLFPLASIGFFNAFNVHGFQMLVLFFLLGVTSNVLQGSYYLMLLTLAYIIPLVLFRSFAGYLSDRWPKRYVVMLCKVVEIVFLLAAAKSLAIGPSLAGIVTYMVILAIQNCFVIPATVGLLPDTFHEREISRATGTFSAFETLGGTFGMVFTLYLFGVNHLPLSSIALILAAFAFVNFLISIYITQKNSFIQLYREKAYPFKEFYLLGWKELFGNKYMFLTALADGLFIAFGLVVGVLLGFHGQTDLDIHDGPSIALLRLAPVLGLMLGCYFAGRISVRKIELGLIPFGAALVAIFILLGVYFPGRTNEIGVALSGGDMVTLKICWGASIYFLLAGFSGGLFLIPIRAYFLQHLTQEKRGATIAAAKSVFYLTLIVINAIGLVFVIGSVKDMPEAAALPAFLQNFAHKMPVFSTQLLMVCIGAVTAIVTFITVWMLPDFAMRFLLLTIGKIFYRVRISGLENIPERGPVMLLSNHASYIDALLIASCTTRRVRFLMQEELFEKPIAGWIARLTGFIKVPGPGKFKKTIEMFENVQKSLRENHIVCVFPEGTPCKNGQIGKFNRGYQNMLPKDLDVPIIPVNIGRVWGSVFSHFQGPIKFRMPREIPYFATITIGKPLPKNITPFEARQAVKELSAEDGMKLAPHEHPMHYILAKNAKLHPFQPIMIDADTGKTFNIFKTFLASVLFSREIRKLNPSDSKYVGVLLPNSTATVLSMFGVLLADKVPCPLNFSTSQEILELSIKKAKMKVVLTNRIFLAKVRLKPTPEMVFLEDIAKQVPTWRKILTMIGIIVLPYKELLNMIAPLSYNDNYGEAALLFSSGSTGIPKGVRLTHHNIYSDCYAMTKSMSFDPRKDSIMGNLPMFHSFGLNTGLFLPFIYRCRPMVYSKSPLDANLIGEAILKYHCTVLVATPSFLQQYLRKFKPEVFDTLKFVISGAEKLRQDIADKFYKAVNGKMSIVEGYGCTELSPVASINVRADIMESGRLSGKPGSIGLCLETICGRIVDPLTYKPVPPETEGLFFVKGPMVMMGYLDEPELNKKALINGYYNTGDIAKMDETGYVTICGRLSRFSKIAGEMVPHEMVECIINEVCGSDERVVAVGSIPDAQKGEALLVLYTPKTPMTPEQIVAELRERSISNLWIPKATNFHLVENLPLLGSGKLDLIALRKVTDEVAAARKAAAEAK